MDPAAPRLRRGAKVIVAIGGGTLAQARQRLKCLSYALVNTDLRLSDGNGLEIMDRPADFGARTSILSGYAFQLPPKAADRHEVLMNRCARVSLPSRSAPDRTGMLNLGRLKLSGSLVANALRSPGPDCH